MRLAVHVIVAAILASWPSVVLAQPAPSTLPPVQQQSFGPGELVDAGQRFFGGVSQGFAGVIEKATRQWGLPNGYVLGEEAGGAFIGGLRYGEGTLYTKNAGDRKVHRTLHWFRRSRKSGSVAFRPPEQLRQPRDV
jgi:hypothetical protein